MSSRKEGRRVELKSSEGRSCRLPRLELPFRVGSRVHSEGYTSRREAKEKGLRWLGCWTLKEREGREGGVETSSSLKFLRLFHFIFLRCIQSRSPSEICPGQPGDVGPLLEVKNCFWGEGGGHSRRASFDSSVSPLTRSPFESPTTGS